MRMIAQLNRSRQTTIPKYIQNSRKLSIHQNPHSHFRETNYITKEPSFKGKCCIKHKKSPVIKKIKETPQKIK